MKEAQQVVAEKTSSLEAEAYKTKRLQVSVLQFDVTSIDSSKKWTTEQNSYYQFKISGGNSSVET